MRRRLPGRLFGSMRIPVARPTRQGELPLDSANRMRDLGTSTCSETLDLILPHTRVGLYLSRSSALFHGRANGIAECSSLLVVLRLVSGVISVASPLYDITHALSLRSARLCQVARPMLHSTLLVPSTDLIHPCF
jgi:hypothetical protein